MADEAGDFLHYQQWMTRETRSVVVGPYLQSYRYFASSGVPFSLRAKDFGRDFVAARGIRVGIHVRRTDQLTPSHGGKDPGARYFAAALRRLPIQGPVVVCTDDAAWVKAQPVFAGMLIRDGTDDAGEDMAILAACEHLVLSIGTFGWWAAFLKEERSGMVVYYGSPFVRALDYSQHFLTHWTGVFDDDLD